MGRSSGEASVVAHSQSGNLLSCKGCTGVDQRGENGSGYIGWWRLMKKERRCGGKGERERDGSPGKRFAKKGFGVS